MIETDNDRRVKRRTMEDRASCGSCAYWVLEHDKSDDGYQNEGICRRRAPVALPSVDVTSDGTSPGGVYGLLAAWPRTFAEDWCGDHGTRADYGGRKPGLIVPLPATARG